VFVEERGSGGRVGVGVGVRVCVGVRGCGNVCGCAPARDRDQQRRNLIDLPKPY